MPLRLIISFLPIDERRNSNIALFSKVFRRFINCPKKTRDSNRFENREILDDRRISALSRAQDDRSTPRSFIRSERPTRSPTVDDGQSDALISILIYRYHISNDFNRFVKLERRENDQVLSRKNKLRKRRSIKKFGAGTTGEKRTRWRRATSTENWGNAAVFS